jgi:hypothetical protein
MHLTIDPEHLHIERTPRGWTAITEDGEVLDVTAGTVPDGTHDTDLVAQYLARRTAAIELWRANDPERALVEIDAALAMFDTVRGRYDRAHILLAAGHWPEGFDGLIDCELSSSVFMRPWQRVALSHNMRPWLGENISGKRLLLMHDHGFGDTIQNLRFVRRLQGMGAEVILLMPPELKNLASQCAPVVSTIVPADFFCSILYVLGPLGITPQTVSPAPYLVITDDLVDAWRGARGRIGIAWAPGVWLKEDYPRAIALDVLKQALGAGAELVSVQQANGKFADFLDCAACILACEQIVSIDTAALHLAGAIGHPRVTGLLSYWHSWRWQAPLYSNMSLCRQRAPDDWRSALEQMQCCR